ncbi:MAG TPA: RDD family protein [Gaiellaceae bacterium]|nr:RDD family protein [Gaiellaceae bacterium]
MYPPPPETAGPPATGGASGPRAGFWRRLAGAFIDGILLSIVSRILESAINPGAGAGVGLVISAAYFTILIGSARGQTLGQMALGIRVIDFNTGGPIGYGRAFIRWIVSIISAIVLFLGYLWMLWDKEKQCWHDKAANDVVVPVQYYPVS